MSEPKPKPCPFCGGEAIYKSWVNVEPLIDAESGAYIDADVNYLEFTGCEPCGIGFWLADDEPEGTTIEKWNRRANDDI